MDIDKVTLLAMEAITEGVRRMNNDQWFRSTALERLEAEKLLHEMKEEVAERWRVTRTSREPGEVRDIL